MPDLSKSPTEGQLLAACAEGDLRRVESLVHRLRDSNPSYGPPYTSMFCSAAHHNKTDVAKYCLDAGAEISDGVIKETVLGHSFETLQLLVDAVRSKDLPWAKFCIERGADPSLHTVDDSIKAIAAAADYSVGEIADLLLKHGAQLDGSGTIILVAEAGELDMVKFLLEHGANINEMGLKDYGDDRVMQEMGSTLHKAVTDSHTDVVKFLLDRGADIELQDVSGWTLLMQAKEKGDESFIELLKEHGAKE